MCVCFRTLSVARLLWHASIQQTNRAPKEHFNSQTEQRGCESRYNRYRSLSGSTVVACINPADKQSTKGTLQFADRAKRLRKQVQQVPLSQRLDCCGMHQSSRQTEHQRNTSIRRQSKEAEKAGTTGTALSAARLLWHASIQQTNRAPKEHFNSQTEQRG